MLAVEKKLESGYLHIIFSLLIPPFLAFPGRCAVNTFALAPLAFYPRFRLSCKKLLYSDALLGQFFLQRGMERMKITEATPGVPAWRLWRNAVSR